MQFPIPWPTSTTKDVPQLGGSGQLVNAIMEQLPDGRINRKRAPGVATFGQSSSGAVHCRGMILANSSQMLVVFNDAIELLAPDGSMSALGVINGNGLVTLAKNIKSPIPDIVCVAGTTAYLVTTTAAPIPYPDPNIGSPNSVCFGDGYFFFTYGSGQCLASPVNNATPLNPLDSIIVNSSSSELLRGVFFAQTLFLFNRDTTEAWVNTANPLGFPFTRSAVIPRGLINNNAVAGYEYEFASTLIFVGSDNVVYLMRGYDPVRISTSDIERRISNVADKTTLSACVYMSEGHAIWELSSSDFTLCFDVTNTYWFERQSNGLNRSRIEVAQSGFGSWIVGDYQTGIIGQISANTFTEYGDTFTYRVQSFPVKRFPIRQIVRKADFDFMSGLGLTPNATPYDPVLDPYANPQVMISWSDDGGASFTMPLQRSLGSVGEYNKVVTLLRTGQATRFGRVWRVEVSDPVYVGLLGGTMESN